MEMKDRDDWTFVNAAVDQGFLFYFFRVRKQLGADLRLLPACHHPNWRHEQSAALGHYAGDCTPEMCLRPAVACDEDNRALGQGSAWFPLTLRGIGEGGKFDRYTAMRVARTLSWGRRTVERTRTAKRLLGC